MSDSVWVVFNVGDQDIDGYHAYYENLVAVCDSESSARNYSNYIFNELNARKKEAQNRYLFEKDRFAIWAVENDGEFPSFDTWLKEHDYDFPDEDRIIKDEAFIYHFAYDEEGYMYCEKEILTVSRSRGLRKESD